MYPDITLRNRLDQFEQLTGFYKIADNLETYILKQFVAHDTFGSQRVSQRYTIFDDKHLYAKNDGTNGPETWVYTATGGGTATFVAAEKCVTLATTTTSGDKMVKETSVYLPYIAGDGQFHFLTGIVGSTTTNCTKRWGRLNSTDGYLWADVDGVMQVGYRSSVSGQTVTTLTPQTSWNVDRLDGEGPSGFTLDKTKFNIYIIYYGWLGGATLVHAVYLHGRIIPVHITDTSNMQAAVTVGTPTLPIRWEIENTGTTSGVNSFKTICTALKSEGAGTSPRANSFTASHKQTLRTNISTRTPILAVRLLTAYNGVANRVLARYKSLAYFVESNTAFIELVKVTGWSSITGGSWTALQANVSACEMNTTLTAVTGGTEHLVDSFYAAVGAGANARAAAKYTPDIAEDDIYGLISQNSDSTKSALFVVYATATGSAFNIGVSLEVDEVP
jgi:hypothetical protein